MNADSKPVRFRFAHFQTRPGSGSFWPAGQIGFLSALLLGIVCHEAGAQSIPPSVPDSTVKESVALDLTPVSDAEAEEEAEPGVTESQEPTSEAAKKDGEESTENSTGFEDSGETPAEPGEQNSTQLPPGQSVIVEPAEDELGERIDDLFRINESSLSWILRGDDSDGIGMLSFESAPAWDFEFEPVDTFEAEFHVNFHWLSGPGRTDLPERLFDLSWHVRVWQPNFIELTGQNPIGIEADFDIGIHSDFEDSAREGWRFPGRLLLAQRIGNSESHWVAGLEYLDLDHIQMIPAGGLIMKSPDAELHFYFPRPRLRLRTRQHESYDEWLYIAGEYRGRGWAIERSATGRADVATLSEYRLGVGWEWEPTRHDKDADEDDTPKISFFDVSWLFGRDLEYRSGIGNFQPQDTVMFRMGTRY